MQWWPVCKPEWCNAKLSCTQAFIPSGCNSMNLSAREIKIEISMLAHIYLHLLPLRDNWGLQRAGTREPEKVTNILPLVEDSGRLFFKCHTDFQGLSACQPPPRFSTRLRKNYRRVLRTGMHIIGICDPDCLKISRGTEFMLKDAPGKRWKQVEEPISVCFTEGVIFYFF